MSQRVGGARLPSTIVVVVVVAAAVVVVVVAVVVVVVVVVVVIVVVVTSSTSGKQATLPAMREPRRITTLFGESTCTCSSLFFASGHHGIITSLPIGPQVVPCYGFYLESYKAILKRNYLGAYGYALSS